MPNPKISVVVATYNVESYIAQTMDSLLAQSYPAHEILIINDGSTDGTLALLDAHYAHLSNVIIHTQQNQGVGVVREVGLKKASGDYVFFCDPDDIVDIELFGKFRDAVSENNDLELYYFSKRSFVESAQDRRLLRRNTAPSRQGWYEKGTELLEDLILIGKYKATTWQYIFKRSLIERFDVSFKGRTSEDQLFSINIYLNSHLCYATQQDLYFQRVREGSLTNDVKDQVLVWAGYSAYRDVMAALKPHLPAFARGQDVAIVYMRQKLNFLISQCVKNDVALPHRLYYLTRQDARDCGAGFRGGLALVAPNVLFFAKKLRFALRGIARRLRGRAG
jgi:glycosyltransferase involved in cell wall biosynthesis